MRIAALTVSYPNLSESFVRRELEGLQARGHEVAVFVKRAAAGPVAVTSSVSTRAWEDANVHAFAPDVLYGSLGMPAHQRTVEVAARLLVPYVLRVWEGYDAFVHPSPAFYREALGDPCCRAVVLEDDWMRRYAAAEMALDGPKVRIIPNGVDVQSFVPGPPRDSRPVRVLAIARFVPKKGLRHLCAAFRALRPEHAELLLIGYGPEEEHLRAVAGVNTQIRFGAPIPPADLVAAYHAADVFAAPCVAIKGGDADGVPTTVLEAMACGLPVLGSDLHSMPLYVEDGVTGLLTPPGDEAALAAALGILLSSAPLRAELGRAGRAAAVERFALATCLNALEAVLAQ